VQGLADSKLAGKHIEHDLHKVGGTPAWMKSI
jgi:hypothetical protein